VSTSFDHIVVLMLENRSFDHMLGFLYPSGVSPSGALFEGLAGTESNPGARGAPVTVFPIGPMTPDAYFMPGADPGEGYRATNAQLYGSIAAPAPGAAAPMQGFVSDYRYTLGWEGRRGWSVVPGTSAHDIMGCFTPQALPVLSGLASGFAVSDQWFGSVPTQTLPNRAFAAAATSQGHMDDSTHLFTARTIFGALSAAGVPWRIYGYDTPPLTLATFTDLAGAPAACSGLFTDFQADAAAGRLPGYAFLEPSWGSTGNSQHPNYDVALGEQLI
jgi:phospholipase C